MTTAIAALVLLALALAPLAWALRRHRAGRDQGGRDRREAAVALHRGQLAELDRDLADGRIAPAEHASAQLEIQRRLLAADGLVETARPASRWPALAPLFLVPLAASALYLVRGEPGMPAMPLAARMAAADVQKGAADQLIATLRGKLAGMDQSSEVARQGYVLLGNAEDGRGNLAAAADAWGRAVAIRFEPGLAALAAEARTQTAGGMVDAESADLFARALAEAPADAPWREIAQKRLQQTGLK